MPQCQAKPSIMPQQNAILTNVVELGLMGREWGEEELLLQLLPLIRACILTGAHKLHVGPLISSKSFRIRVHASRAESSRAT